MAKIRFQNWKDNIPAMKMANGFLVSVGFRFWQTTSVHGRSKGKVHCPCCEYQTEIYLWSFRGGGKRCDVCNVLLGSSGAYIENKELSPEGLLKLTLK